MRRQFGRPDGCCCRSWGDTEFTSDGHCCRSIDEHVATGSTDRDVDVPPRCDEMRAWPTRVVDADIGDAHVGIGGFAEEDDPPRWSDRRHRPHPGIVGVEHGDTVFGERCGEFGLRPRDTLDPSHSLTVGFGHGGDHADTGSTDTAESGDLAETSHTHFEYEGLGVVGSAENGDGKSLIVVERTNVGGRPQTSGERSRAEVLRRRLPHRTGDADDVGTELRPSEPCQVGQRLARIGHHDRRHTRDRSFDEAGDGSGCHRRTNEIVPVASGPECDEEHPRSDGTRVEVGTVEHDVVADEFTTDGRRRLARSDPHRWNASGDDQSGSGIDRPADRGAVPVLPARAGVPSVSVNDDPPLIPETTAPLPNRIRLVVLFGGQSAEHDVSCVTAAHVLRAVDRTRYDIVAVGIDRDGRWWRADDAVVALDEGRPLGRLEPRGAELTRGAIPASTSVTDSSGASDLDGVPVTVVMPLLHGPLGEDGTMQGLLELAGVPYVGSGVLASAVAMDKAIAKQLLSAAGIAQARHRSIRAHHVTPEHLDDIAADLGYPLFVKPCNMGSSVGISKVHAADEMAGAVQEALRFDEWIVFEEAVIGREIEVAVLGDIAPAASVPGEIIPGREFYDYEDKYVEDGARLCIPASLDDHEARTVRSLAVEVYRTLRCSGMARVDFFYEEGGRGFLCNEVNTIPGFTPISMYPKLWEASGISYSELIDHLVALALAP
jgi:D-alanine-D-alanine ligase